jgi:hypothetical protein
MNAKLTLLVAGVLSAIALTGAPARAAGQQPLVITDVRGSVRTQLKLPCGDPLDQTTPITSGRMDIRPEILTREREIVSVTFDLTRLDLFLAPFAVHRACNSIDATAAFREIGVRLAGATRFPGEEVGTPGSGQYRFVIPKDQFLIYESILDNASVSQPETNYQRPSQDVFGVIDLPRNIVQLHVVLNTQVRFRAGCVRGGRCLIDQKEDVTQTADVVSIGERCHGQPSVGINSVGGTTAPSLSCTASNSAGIRFLVLASDDDCVPPIITFGPYTIANGEVIQLRLSDQPGVRLLNTSRNGIRRFQVGRGDAFVTATDLAGNTTTASCR